MKLPDVNVLLFAATAVPQAASTAIPRPKAFHRGEVDRGVLADGSVGTAAGLDAHDALGR